MHGVAECDRMVLITKPYRQHKTALKHTKQKSSFGSLILERVISPCTFISIFRCNFHQVWRSRVKYRDNVIRSMSFGNLWFCSKTVKEYDPNTLVGQSRVFGLYQQAGKSEKLRLITVVGVNILIHYLALLYPIRIPLFSLL